MTIDELLETTTGAFKFFNLNDFRGLVFEFETLRDSGNFLKIH